MAARIAGFAAKANQAVRFHSVQFGGLLNQTNALGVVQGRLYKDQFRETLEHECDITIMVGSPETNAVIRFYDCI